VRIWAIVVASHLLAVGQVAAAAPWKGADASIRVTVLDDALAPVTNATVVGHFASPYGKDYMGDRFDLRTDASGQCRVVGRGFTFISGRVSASNHYPTHYRIALGDRQAAIESGLWKEVSETLILKRIKNPVPMYVSRLSLAPAIANPGVTASYDFATGAWLPPHGDGQHADVEIVYEKRILRSTTVVQRARPDDVRKQTDRDVEQPLEWDESWRIEFHNRGDGLVRAKQKLRSELRSDYHAPVEGYESSIRLFANRRQERLGWPGKLETNMDEDALYYIRIRAEVDEHGTVKSAWYGKICGEMNREPSCYVNPDGTRNVEFAPEMNLLDGPSSHKEIHEP